MKITFYGAAREVTGSRHLLEVNGKKILLDCGMYQGHRDEAHEKNTHFKFDPTSIDAVCLSHAHIDHSGALPQLAKQGFQGTIYTTFATRDLATYMLIDSAFIQEREAEYLNKRKAKKGEALIEPEYNSKDAQAALDLFCALPYQKTTEIFPGINLTLYNAGHILGSAIIQLDIKDEEDGKTKKLVFTGDLGRKNLPILKNPYQIESADYLIIEATYGNRLHEAITDVEERMMDIVTDTIKKGGKLIIPAFSLGRTQEIVYTLHRLFDAKKIPEGLPIVVDSPLSGNLTEVFKAHPQDFDKEAREQFMHGGNPFGFGRLRYTTSVEESKALNESKMPMIIISSSGMCEHGRILHHLKNAVEDPRNTILIVGFMAKNTLGRKIIEKEKEVNIFGEPYALRARVEVIDAFSGHADRSDLLDYILKVHDLKKIFLVHCEDQQGETFKKYLGENDVQHVEIPAEGDSFGL